MLSARYRYRALHSARSRESEGHMTSQWLCVDCVEVTAFVCVFDKLLAFICHLLFFF